MLPRISFYVGQGSSLRARLLLACRLVEKGLAQGMRIYVHTDSPATSERMDELLWTFDEQSFIPHAYAPCPDPQVNVLLGHAFEPTAQDHCALLVNLSNDLPPFLGVFERMAEIIDQEEAVLLAGRKRYQLYRNQGYTLDYHQL